jgi:hypothetical protein
MDTAIATNAGASANGVVTNGASAAGITRCAASNAGASVMNGKSARESAFERGAPKGCAAFLHASCDAMTQVDLFKARRFEP